MLTAGRLSCSKCERDAKYIELRCSAHPIIDPPDGTLEPFDGKPPLRPHSIPGWWQIWSGGICIALLRPEDIEPILVTPRAKVTGK